ncbi:hypothetical protein DPMN_054320 [Dreissena polymorpha]|uniref:Uncharacterized protein n=1 Tax=Dreissena polymorpha TaxID=45954 RepID=A0A9D4HRH2_DREPO|nr:hypothetical protein DPMN_054320 [Dreissena polymorpha]
MCPKDMDASTFHLLSNFDTECLRNVNAYKECLQTKCGRTDDGQRQILKPHLSNQTDRSLYTFLRGHNNVTSRVFTRETAPPPTPGGHVFRLIGTIFELI